MPFAAPKGTADVLPAEASRWRFVERIARDVATTYHFGEIRTPVFEATELFHRGVGETTDIVHKETFTFPDRGGDSLTLRPEGTAGVVRAVIENGLLNDAGARVKVFYVGPNFRYERPQKGRLRIHHQFGVEAFGVADPVQDVECIELQLDFYRRCGVNDLSLRVNSLGDADSKARYRDRLVTHLAPRVDRLSEDSRRRLLTHPLRILDSKDPADREAVADAPPAAESLSDASRAHFDAVRTLLREADVSFTVDPTLVRGFDYYTETLWEVTAEGLGSQNALGGGGRYDTLVRTLGGRATPGVGFGSGIERLLIALDARGAPFRDDAPPLAWVVWAGEQTRSAAMSLLRDLRAAGLAADFDPVARSFKTQLKQANRANARVCLILGPDELIAGNVTLKHLSTGEQSSVPRVDAVAQAAAVLAAPTDTRPSVHAANACRS